MGKIIISAAVTLMATAAFTTVPTGATVTTAGGAAGTSSSPGSQPGNASLTAFHPVALEPVPEGNATKDYECGSLGLSVTATSADDKENACETAMKVAKAAIEGGAPGPPGGFTSLTVQVDGQTWSCQDRQGDNDENPHGMCANNSRESEQIRLYS